MTDPTPPHEPFVPPYVLNASSVELNGDEVWPLTPPPPSRPPGRRRWLVPVIVLSIVVFISGLVAIGAVAVQTVASHRPSVADPYRPAPAASDPSTDTSATPTASASPVVTSCPPACLDVNSSGLMIPNGSLQISTSVDQLLVSADFSHPTSAAQEYQADASAMAAQTALPSACFFMASRSPISPSLGGPDSTSADPVTFLGENVNDSHTTLITQSARFFPDSASATDYLRRLSAQVVDCHIAHPAIDSEPNTEVQPALDVPGSITVVAIAETGKKTSTYIYDLQRANAVVRFRVVNDGSVPEQQITHFLSTWATTDLAQLDTTQ